MWRDSSASSTSMAKPNAWGSPPEISRRSQFNNSEVQSPSASNNTNGGHIPSSNASSGINSGPTTDDWKIGRIFTTEDMTERVLFGKSGLEGAMERLTVVSVVNCYF